jgi:aspartyl/asparaginyl-tRNA synthetase
METLISKFKDVVGQTATIKGWAYNVRSSGSIAFLQIRDGSGFTQAVVAKQNVDDASWNAAIETTIESSVIVTGTVSKHPKQEGVYELQATSVQLVQKPEGLVFEKKPEFGHGNFFRGQKISLLCSYHPSRQNTQTGRLTRAMWAKIFKKARAAL